MAATKRIIKYLNAYRAEIDTDKRLAIAKHIFDAIESALRLYVLARVPRNDADDVLSESFKAIFTSLQGCKAKEDGQFFSWCYGITAHKVADYYRKKETSSGFETLPIDEFENILQASTQRTPPSPGERLDLVDAMNLLAKAKPNCRDLLLTHFIDDLDVMEIAERLNLKYHAALRRIERCLDFARSLMTD